MKTKLILSIFLLITISLIIFGVLASKDEGLAKDLEKEVDIVGTKSETSPEPLEKAQIPEAQTTIAKAPVESSDEGPLERPPVSLPGEPEIPSIATFAPPAGADTLDDPREHGGAIIPVSPTGTFVPGLAVQATVTIAGQSGALTPDQMGGFPQIVVTPNAVAQVTLSYPTLSPGDPIQLATPDGGLINGESGQTMTLDQNSSVSFQWEGNDNLGRFVVVLQAGPDEDYKTLNFWSGPRAYSNASTIDRSPYQP